MQMPPFMRNSNADALALAWWQYDLLMAWVAGRPGPAAGDVPEPGRWSRLPGPRRSCERRPAAEVGLPPLSPAAAERRRQVLDTLGDDDVSEGSAST